MKQGKTLILIFVFLFGFIPALAQEVKPTEYQLLAPVPELSKRVDNSNCITKDGKPCATTATYIPGLFKLMIMATTGLAVLMLIYAGIKYMSTDAFSQKDEAKGIIENVLWGLLLAMSSWLIVNTINPNLVNFDLKLERIEIKPIPLTAVPGGIVAGSCAGCVVISVPHKPAPNGCKAPGPCTIQGALNTKLVALHGIIPLRVSEGYPPTVPHDDPCHNTGSCVDLTISSNTPQNVKKLLEEAERLGLNAKFEVTSQTRYMAMTTGGVPSSKVMLNPESNGEHFHVK